MFNLWAIDFKPVDKDNSEYRIFTVLMLIATAICLLVVFVDIFLYASWARFIVAFSGFCYFFIAYLILRLKRIFQPVLYPTIVIIFLSGPTYWTSTDHLTVAGALIHIATLIGALLISPYFLRHWVVGVFVLSAIVYAGFNVWSVESLETGNVDVLISNFYFVVIIGAVSYATIYLRSRYEHERQGMNEFGRSLRALYSLNLTEWTSIEEAFQSYLQTSANLLGAKKSLIVKKEWNKWRIIKEIGFQWEGDIDSFSTVYDSEIGDMRVETIINAPSNLSLLKEPSGSMIVAPIFVGGLLYGHTVFSFEPRKVLKEYDLELAVLVGQNLGHMIISEETRQEERKTREALNLSEVRFKRIFERANIGIAVADLNGSFLMTNPAFQHMLGYSEEELLQMSFKNTGHPDDYHNDLAQYKSLIAGEIEGYQIEKRNIRKDGEVIKTMLTVSLINDFQGSPMYGIGIIEDITNRKRNEERIKTLNNELAYMIQGLESANKELESFSYSVSHDLRAPLRAINGFSKILVDEYGPLIDEEGNRLINIISSNAKKMGSLIDDLLSFSQLSRQAKHTERVALDHLVKDIMEDLELQYPVKDIIKIPEPLPEIRADRNLLRQALINILTNALKFSSHRDNPEVTIRTEMSKEDVTISVGDNGVGFDMKYHEKLFRVFQRLHTDKEFSGTGVGLAIAERIVSHHGGRIWAESRPNAGAIFYIKLPLQEKAMTVLS